jgi:hypothetical protein
MDTRPERAVVTPDEVLARVFGVLESLIALSVGLGGLAVPLVIHLLGTRGALVAVGALAPAGVLLAWTRLRALDRTMRRADLRISLLRQAAMQRPPPVPTLEYLAKHLEPEQVAAGSAVFKQGRAAITSTSSPRGRRTCTATESSSGAWAEATASGRSPSSRKCHGRRRSSPTRS